MAGYKINLPFKTGEFDIDLTYQRAVVDAKSILGVFALGLERPLVVNCHGTNQEFEESISKFTM